MSKLLITILSLLFLAQSVNAQRTNNGSVSGTIKTSDGKPAASVTVRIERSKWAVSTDENGKYQIKNIRPGSWVLRVSSVGAASLEKQITIVEGSVQSIDFTLKENAVQLEEVVISTKNLNKQNSYVAKMPLKNLENPQVYTSVSSEIIKQQGVTNYDDALRNVPGLTRTWESTGRAGDGASYFALRGFDAQPSLYNGLPGLTSGNLDPANIEEIQVIKGPSGTLFGGSFYSYGGIINTITKKPFFNYGGEVAYNFGSYGLNRITADINAPLSKKEKIALRVNTAYHTENSFQDAGYRKSFFVAPTLLYQVNDRLTFQLNTEILDEERAVAPIFFHSDRFSPLKFKSVEEVRLNNKLSFTTNDLSIRNPRFNMQGQMLYKLSDKWSSQTVFSRETVRSDGFYTYLWEDTPDDPFFQQYVNNQQQTTNTTDLQQNFNGDITIGGIRNRILVGLDYFNRNVIDNGSGWAVARSVTPQGEIDSLSPIMNLTRAAVDQLLAETPAFAPSNLTNSSYSIYASDVVNITQHLMAMVTLRADYFRSSGEKTTADGKYDQVLVSPKFGLLYQPIPDRVSVFVNYLDGFINIAPQNVYDADGSNQRQKSFDPEHATQLEFGAKSNLFSNKLSATISAYDIRVRDRVYPNPENPNDVIQGGKVRSRGFEFDLIAYPSPGFNVIAGYSYNETKIQKGAQDDFYSEPGRAPGGQGPQNLVNIWANYTVPTGKLKNFGMGIGGNYGSRYRVIDNSATGIFDLPAYTLVNAALFYDADKYRISCNVNNITNTQYYIGYWSINPQRRANFVASVAFKF